MDIMLGARSGVDFGDGSSGIGATASGLNLSGDVSVPVILTHVDYQ
jgi:TPP-dependent pyruvate/acetoin dehydrogenase alpha subunit